MADGDTLAYQDLISC